MSPNLTQALTRADYGPPRENAETAVAQVVVVDGGRALRYAQDALTNPPAVGGRGGLPGVSCVGLDVENCPTTNSAMLLQVCCLVVCRFGVLLLASVPFRRGGG